jgi:hypothetical protein
MPAGLQDSSFSSSMTISMLGEASGRFELANIFPGVYDVFASLADIRGSGHRIWKNYCYRQRR